MTDPRIHYSKRTDIEQPIEHCMEHVIECVSCNGTGYFYNEDTGKLTRHSKCGGRGWYYDDNILINEKVPFDDGGKARERFEEEARLFQKSSDN